MNPLLGFLISEFVMSLPWIPRERAKMEFEAGFEELGLGFVIMIASQLCHCLLSFVQGCHGPDHLATSLYTHAHTCAHLHTRMCTHRPSDLASIQHCFPLQSWNRLPLFSTYVWVRPPQIFNSLFYFSRDFESLLTCQRNFPPLETGFFLYSPRTACRLAKKERQGSLGSCQKEQMQPQHGAPDLHEWPRNILFVKGRTEAFSSPCVSICILLGTQ